MARQYAPPSILRGLRQGHAASLRRVMNALMRRIARVTEEAAAQLSELNDTERNVVKRIMASTLPINDLLVNMVIRFASARYGNSITILQAANDFNSVAVEAVQTPIPGSLGYVAARTAFRNLIQAGRFIYNHDGINEYGEVMPDAGEETFNSKSESDVSNTENKSTRGTGRGIKKRNWTQRVLGALQDSEDEVNDDEEDSIKWPGKHYKANPLKPNAPVRPQGCQCINDGTHDRLPAAPGHPDNSKLSMTFRLQKEDPKGSGNWVPAGRATYEYLKEIDWEDPESVAPLNAWRQGNFIRQIGPKNDARIMWLDLERDALVAILQRELAAPEIRGRWHEIRWGDVYAQYIAIMQGTIQRAGEMTASRQQRTRQAGVVASVSRPIKEDREAPTRTVAALKNQILHFMDPRARKLVADAKEADKDAGDDEESEEEDEMVIPKPKTKNRKGKETTESDGGNDDVESHEGDETPKPKKAKMGKGKAAVDPKGKGKAKDNVVEDSMSDWEDSGADGMVGGGGEVLQDDVVEEMFDRDTEAAMKASREDKQRKDREDRGSSSAGPS